MEEMVLVDLLTISVITTVAESGILFKLVANAVERKRRFHDYARLAERISSCISEYEHNYKREPWRRAEIELSVHGFGSLLAAEDENYLKLSGAILRRFLWFMTPDHAKLFAKADFLDRLKRSMLDLGMSVSNRDKDCVVKGILGFYDLTYKYPRVEIDDETSRQLEEDIAFSCKVLRSRESHPAFRASRILESWKRDQLIQAETSLILLGTNTRYMIRELAFVSDRARIRTSIELERAIEYRKTDMVRSFDAQSNALCTIIAERPAWKPTKFERSFIYIFPQSRAELHQIPILSWTGDPRFRRSFS